MDELDDEGGDDAPYTHAYAFIPRATLQGVYADRFMDVSVLQGHTPDTWKDLIATYEAMGMGKDNIADMESIVGTIETMFMRARFQTDSATVHMVKTQSPIDWDTMDRLLTNKQREGTLTAFLRQSRIG